MSSIPKYNLSPLFWSVIRNTEAHVALGSDLPPPILELHDGFHYTITVTIELIRS